MPGRHRSKDEKALAIASSTVGSQGEAIRIAGIPASTVRGWIRMYETWNDSELDALIAAKKRAMGAGWALLGVEAQEFARELREAGKAKDFLSAATAAGICATKLELLGAPKDVTPQSTDSNPTIIVPHRQGSGKK